MKEIFHVALCCRPNQPAELFIEGQPVQIRSDLTESADNRLMFRRMRERAGSIGAISFPEDGPNSEIRYSSAQKFTIQIIPAHRAPGLSATRKVQITSGASSMIMHRTGRIPIPDTPMYGIIILSDAVTDVEISDGLTGTGSG